MIWERLVAGPAMGLSSAAFSFFYQIFTLNVVLSHCTIPQIFALLPNKREETYLRLFTQLKTTHTKISPETIITNFEKSIYNAVKTAFPPCSITGCLCNTCQNVYRKIVEQGCKKKYETDRFPPES